MVCDKTAAQNARVRSLVGKGHRSQVAQNERYQAAVKQRYCPPGPV